MALFDFNALPGLGTATETAEKMFLWGKHEQTYYRSAVVVSTSTDKGSGVTTTLRSGLVMAYLSSTGKWKPYDPDATDGTELAAGILSHDLRMLNTDGSAADRTAVMVVGGAVKGASLLYNAPVSATGLTGLDQQGRAQLNNRFIFDDDLVGNPYGWKHWIPKTADYTVLAADNGTVFTTAGATGAVTYTLPALLDANSNPVCKGMRFKFVNEVDQNMKVQVAGSDTMVTFNNASAASVTFSTASNKIGAVVEIETNAAGTKWVSQFYGANTVTVA
jgi:hypothetical protein